MSQHWGVTVLQAFKRYADFGGRSGRSEYWLFFLFNILVGFGISIVAGIGSAIGGETLGMGAFGLLYVVFFLATIVPSIAVGFRRLHDTDRSAWWYLLAFVPFGAIVLIVFFCLPGTPGPNRYGEPA
jgi:uncharacterized membrane protein YhaH (DUF805 family)